MTVFRVNLKSRPIGRFPSEAAAGFGVLRGAKILPGAKAVLLVFQPVGFALTALK